MTALKDTAAAERVRKKTITAARDKTSASSRALGYQDAAVAGQLLHGQHSGGQVQPVIEEFRGKGMLVGRPFPPMLDHLRVSVGTPDEMRRFLGAFKEIVGRKTAA